MSDAFCLNICLSYIKLVNSFTEYTEMTFVLILKYVLINFKMYFVLVN